MHWSALVGRQCLSIGRPRLRWLLPRSVLLIGVVGTAAGSLLLGAAAAHAADPSGVGTDPTANTLTFTDHTTNAPVTSGPGSELLNWNTKDACPAPDNASAFVATFDADTNRQDSFASLLASGPGPYAGTAMDDSVANLWTDFTDSASPTFEVAVVCSSGSVENEQRAFVYYQYAYITYNQSANSFQILSGDEGQAPTSTTVTSADNTNTTLPVNTANTGDAVTFIATVADTVSSAPEGSVTFQANGTNIGTEPVNVGAFSGGGGAGATVTATFSTSGSYRITAAFSPAGGTPFAPSSASLTEMIQSPAAIGTPVLENLSVPQNGTLAISVSTAAIPLTAVTGSYVATGNFGTQSPTGPNSTTSTAGVEVTDTRNTFPGWSVTGQTSDFTLSSNTISGIQLGWAPNTGETWATSGTAEATLGAPVTPAAPGLGGTAAMLFAAPAGGGNGTFDASAALTLVIPTTVPPGSYTGTLTITALTSAV